METLIDTGKPRFYILKDSLPQCELYFDSSSRLTVRPNTPEQFETLKQQSPLTLAAVTAYHAAKR